MIEKNNTGKGAGKILYLSDLDGTLLRPEGTLSPYTAEVINRWIKGGGLFSYATARPSFTAAKVMMEINIQLPVIVYNGALIKNSATNEVLYSTCFTPKEVKDIREFLTSQGIYPIAYSFIDGRECSSHVTKYDTEGVKFQLRRCEGDASFRHLEEEAELYKGEMFYFVCNAEETVLAHAYEILMQDKRLNLDYYRGSYSGMQWLEIMPSNASKAKSMQVLKAMLSCDRVTAFGDGPNDVSLFEAADECYAVENAKPELKALATAVIRSNREDGVARWVEENA